MPIPAGSSLQLSSGPTVSGIDGDTGGNNSGHVFNFNGGKSSTSQNETIILAGIVAAGLALIYVVVK